MYNNIVVSEAYSDVRAMARNVMRRKWFMSALALLIYTFLSSNLPNMLGAMIPAFKRTIYLNFVDRYYEYSTFPGLYSLVIEAAFTLGLAMFVLNFIRAGKVSLELLFSGFEKFIKAFLINLIMSIIIFVGLVLFIVPGIIFGLMYSQAYYILADNPELGAVECLRRSRIMMIENKGYLFGLRLSFIGWALLAAISIVVGEYILQDIIITSPVVKLLVHTVVEIPMYFVLAYLQVTNGIFYELASGHIRPVVNPTYANMYGSLNQNGPSDNQGFNQNMYDNNQGYNQNMPNKNPGYGQNMPNSNQGYNQNMPNNNPGYGQNMPNSNQGYNQNMPNDNQGYGIQNQNDFNHGVDKNQASFGETEIQEAQNVQQDAVNSSETQADSDENFDTER